MSGRLTTVTAIFTTYWPTISGRTGRTPTKASVTKITESTPVESVLDVRTRIHR